MKIGDMVWLMDENRRHYHKGSIVYREYFYPVEITGETRDSWLLKESRYLINKKTGKLRKPAGGFFALHEEVYPTEKDVANAVWVHDNRYRIGTMVHAITDAALLRAVEQLIS